MPRKKKPAHSFPQTLYVVQRGTGVEVVFVGHAGFLSTHTSFPILEGESVAVFDLRDVKTFTIVRGLR